MTVNTWGETEADIRFLQRRSMSETPADPCHDCGDWRTLYCNVDGFGYCVKHYPLDLL